MNILKKNFGKRKQLFEIQDFPLCPKVVRDGVTDLLVLNLKIVPIYAPVIPWLSKFAKITNGHWVDLCAGAGGGSLILKEKLPGQIKKLILTDLYPHETKNILPENVIAYQKPVDARNVPIELKGFRTLFTSFHHLNDQVALEVLKNAMNTNTPLGIFEFTDRSIYCLLLMLPSFFTSFFLIPFIRPWKLSRFFWTYFIPLIPIVTLIDITLSCFRTRNVEEMNTLLSKIKSENYTWESGRIPTYFGLSITYTVGQPKEKHDQ
jgi:hypothetical protein